MAAMPFVVEYTLMSVSLRQDARAQRPQIRPTDRRHTARRGRRSARRPLRGNGHRAGSSRRIARGQARIRRRRVRTLWGRAGGSVVCSCGSQRGRSPSRDRSTIWSAISQRRPAALAGSHFGIQPKMPAPASAIASTSQRRLLPSAMPCRPISVKRRAVARAASAALCAARVRSTRSRSAARAGRGRRAAPAR